MVKVILQLYPVLPATEAERREKRPVGRDSEKYQTAVHEMVDIVKACEDLGLWGVSVIEHHFHSEGYEIGPNPGLMNAFWAASTSKIRVGQLGWTMSTHNPIRVAEDTAIIDHLTRGRTFVGFSRGYQSRWTDVIGQHYGSKATKSPSGLKPEERAKMSDAEYERLVADDRINRELFEEGVDLVLDAWTSESIQHNGKHWKVPFPYEEGIEWGMKATREMGAPGEVDENGRIRRVSVTPSPYTDPHPPVFVASNASVETIEYCGPRGFIPCYFSKIETAERFGQAYVDSAAAAGYEYQLGQNQALTRWLQIAETTEEARRNVELYDLDIFRDLYTGTTPLKLEGDPIDAIANCGMWAVGNPTEVRDILVEQWKRLPAEYLVIPSHFAQQPKEEVIRQLELLMTHVKPALDELTDY